MDEGAPVTSGGRSIADQTYSKFKGLTDEEVNGRLSKYGFNEIESKKQSVFLRFASRFIGAIPLMLYLVIGISIYLGNVIDAYVVIGLVIFNGIAAFLEEYKADNTLELLKKKLSVSVNVKRNGAWTTVPSREIVPGDLIRVKLGNVIAADAKIVESNYLSVDQSMLTGESLPVDKKEGDLVFSSSIVREGEATCTVLATGKNTNFGMTAELVKLAKAKSHLENNVLRILKYLMVLDVFLILAVFIGSLIFGIPLLSIIPFALLILLTSVPVALPASFTVAMAYGTERLSSKNILVTKLEAIEEASTINVLCLDKTGTITKNELSASAPLNFGNFSKLEVLKYAALASRVEDNDQIDLAVLSEAQKAKIDLGKYRALEFKPFDPSTKTSGATVQIDDSIIQVIKGFPSKVMERCGLSQSETEQINRNIQEIASGGFRVIGVGIKAISDWEFVGLFPLSDSPREDSRKLIEELRSLGISLKMLTGDSRETATAIADEVNIGKNIVSVDQLEGKSTEELFSIISEADGFAGVYPKDKFMIVKALQDNGQHVGMTGDGVNDAPALKQAEVGIAVSNATDVAKSAASIVLTSSGIEPIVNAVEESRSIFERMITYTLKKVSKVLQTSVFLSVGFILLRFLPMLPVQLIIALFLSDIGSISLSTDNERFSSQPDAWNLKAIFKISMIFGLSAIAQVVMLAYIGLKWLGLSEGQFQTLIFLTVIVSMELMTLSMRERKSFWSSRPSGFVSAQIVSSILIASALGYFGILMAPIGLYEILTVICGGLVFLIFTDAVKILSFRRFGSFSSI